MVVQNAGDPAVVSMWILSAAAGSFLYIALVDLIPEMNQVHTMNPEDTSSIDVNSWSRIIAQVFHQIRSFNL